MRKKYTLSLPTDLYDELKSQADNHDISVTEVVRQCLKFGLVGMKISEDSKLDMYIREQIDMPHASGADELSYKESRIEFIW